ncbi:MAG: HAD-IC family P-type ATPase, partial [Bdellovibrionales bacterium]|nr:HAD-IC family P-type ATPase [Bdellovibrionales bacterium]
GESVPVEKRDDFIAEPKASVGDRKNLLHKGTLISRGRGQGIVVRTGLNTELGQIALLLETAEQVQTPLQKRLDQFSRKLTWFLLLICLLLFGVGILHGQDWLSMLMTAVSLAVAAIPEALPSVIVIALAVGAKRMVSRRALIQKLSAVEALGSTTVICSDKTGTLTQNKMTVVRSWIPYPEREELFYTNLALNNDVRWQDRTRQLAEGEPTEKALFLHAYHHGKDKEELGHTWPRVNEFPFDPKEKLMVTQHQQPDATFYFLKGAPEVVLQLCQDDTSVTNGTQHAMQMAEGGLRVLAFAWFQSSSPIANLDLDFIHSAKWELLGFAGMIDPPRPEVKQAIQDCLTAGIRVQMITGDHPRTALAIARELKIEGDGLTGEELEKISPESLALRIGQIGVFARTAPKQKIRIVQALQAQGEMVAMTGDGVNDAPALKQAHIGVAMGKIGTDVAREAS